MKKTTLLLSFSLVLAASGLAQPVPHWPKDQNILPTEFIPLSEINALSAQGAFKNTRIATFPRFSCCDGGLRQSIRNSMATQGRRMRFRDPIFEAAKQRLQI